MSIGPEQFVGNLLLGNMTSLSEKITDGKSGNFFFFSHDSHFLCKTISHGELATFLQMLPHYFEFCRQHPDTLITHYVGLYKLNDIPLVVMQNVLMTSRKLQLYDLKGSTIGRTNPTGKGILKDLDFINSERVLMLGSRKSNILQRIESDVKFLQSNHIIDYSLLVGIYTVNGQERNVELAGIPDENGREVYYIGIIDTLITYGTSKFVEHHLKSVWYGNEHGVSVVDPEQYATRFMAFVTSIVA
jgi:hypothetical protein